MPQGLQVWDANGVLVTDITTRIGRIHTSFESGTANGSRVVGDLSLGGTPFVFLEDNSQDIDMSNLYAYPNVSVSGQTVSWAFVDYAYPNTTSNVPRRSVKISVGSF